MSDLSKREWSAYGGGLALFVGGVAGALLLRAADGSPTGLSALAAIVSIVGVVLLVAAVVNAVLRGDTEGVEREQASRAALLALLVVVVSGFGYALLEAFAGFPRLTAAVPATLGALVWMLYWTWQRRDGDGA